MPKFAIGGVIHLPDGVSDLSAILGERHCSYIPSAEVDQRERELLRRWNEGTLPADASEES